MKSLMRKEEQMSYNKENSCPSCGRKNMGFSLDENDECDKCRREK